MKTITALTLLAFVPAPAFAQSNAGDRALNKSTFLSGAEQRFENADADGDGVWTREEYTAFRLDEFDAGDRNQDGVISRGELRGLKPSDQAAEKREGGHLAAAGFKSGLTRETFEKQIDRRFDDLAEGGETVSQERYLAASEAAFDAADKNGDGLIRRGELRGLVAL